MIIQNDSTARVEVTYRVHRKEDTVTVSRQTFTVPVNGNGVQWRKGEYDEQEMFTVPTEEIPSLMERLAVALMLSPGDFV